MEPYLQDRIRNKLISKCFNKTQNGPLSGEIETLGSYQLGPERSVGHCEAPMRLEETLGSFIDSVGPKHNPISRFDLFKRSHNVHVSSFTQYNTKL